MTISTPQQALLLSLCAALSTVAIKTAAWWLTDSVAFLSDALESVVNVAGASFALAMVAYARRPADSGHPFGHGKAEYFSAAFEGGMIFIAAVAILATAGERLLHPRPVEELGLGTALSVLASVVNFLVARKLLSVSRTHRSVALEADAHHLMTDVWTTAGVVVGVALGSATGLYWLDPMVAALVALNILRAGWRLVQSSTGGLMDRALDDEAIVCLIDILEELAPRGCTYANLRTRAAGPMQFAQVDLQVPPDWSVRYAHDLADELERAAAKRGIILTTHIEPLADGSTV